MRMPWSTPLSTAKSASKSVHPPDERISSLEAQMFLASAGLPSVRNPGRTRTQYQAHRMHAQGTARARRGAVRAPKGELRVSLQGELRRSP